MAAPNVPPFFMTLTKDSCFAAASSFSSKTEFKNKSNPEYQWLCRNGLLAQACAHIVPAHRALTDADLAVIASRYKTKGGFKLADQSAYLMSIRRGILDRVCLHMDVKHRLLSDDQIASIANEYTARIDFLTGDSAAYQTASKRGILDRVCAHMTSKGDRTLADAEILAIARTFKTRMDFKLGDFGAYTTAIRRGLIVQACAHMEHGATGFREDKPAVLYQFRIEFPDGLVLYKAGITNRTPKQRMLTMGINPGYKAELVGFIRFDTGRDAKIAEKRLHRKNSSRRHGGPPVMRNGNTELFTASVLEI
jgi:hypothetical protein